MISLFIAFENDEWCHRLWCHFMACVLFLSVSFLFRYFFCGFYYFLDLRQVCQYLYKQSIGVVPRFLGGVSVGELLQPYLIINATGLVQFEKNLNYTLPPLVCQNYLRQSISVKLIYQFLDLIICSLDAFKKLSKKKETRIKKKIVKQSRCYNNLISARSSRRSSVKTFFLDIS